MNLWLVGMMGSGKTTVGRLVATAAETPFRDVDLMVEKRLATTISELWEREGEESFRAIESTIIAELAAGDGAVISTGGGAILSDSNGRAMRRSGTVVWLQAPPGVLASRVAGSIHRPALGSGGEGRLAVLLEERLAAYQAVAHRSVSTDGTTPAQTAQVVGQWL